MFSKTPFIWPNEKCYYRENNIPYSSPHSKGVVCSDTESIPDSRKETSVL